MMGTINKSGKSAVLFVASVIGHIEHFHKPYLELLKSMGYEIHVAAFGECSLDCVDHHFNIEISRSPFTFRNLGTYRRLKHTIDNGGYKLIHCHTPNASVLTRIASRMARTNGTVVAYTSHGFHFYTGGRRLNNFIYLNVERFCARYTDFILTINREDYEAVTKYKFKCGKAYITNGVGVDSNKFKPVSPEYKLELRKKIGIPDDAFVLIYPAEFIPRKNHAMLLDMMRKIHDENIILILAGKGVLFEDMKRQNADKRIWFPGMIRGIADYYAASDLDVASSRQEGMGLHIVEAMSTGLPSVATAIRGHCDVVHDSENGYLVDLDDSSAMAERVLRLYNDRQLYSDMSKNAIKSAKCYSLEKLIPEYEKLYIEMLAHGEKNYKKSVPIA